jgi:WD40 repeat protein
MPLAAGTHLGPYETLGLLGAGGMGEVYRARDARLGREVAVKVLPEQVACDPVRLARLQREARAIAALNHPNILTVHDVGTSAGRSYVVTELLQGETLRQAARSGERPQSELLQLAIQVAQGLEAAHAKGIVHRDIKPENVFVTRDGRAKILDFGVAKLSDGDVEPAAERGQVPNGGVATGAGFALGTVAYMSPEQVRGHPVDHRTDIFSLGVVLYELLSGEHPFRRETAMSTIGAILEETPQELATLSRSIAPALSRVVATCLEKSREARFRSAHDVACAIEAVLAEPAARAGLDQEERSPYPGLTSFTEKDAGIFFGRQQEVAELWSRLRTRRLLAVIGPSGAGKTSFVRAGLIPARPRGWAALYATPGRRPALALAQALTPELAGDAAAIGQLLRGLSDSAESAEDAWLVAAVIRWRSAHAEAVLVLDQFEELFTLNAGPAQQRFAALVARLVDEAGVHVVLVLRDDFLMCCHEHPPLAPLFRELLPLGVPTRDALRAAVLEPARRRGYSFEDERLADDMVRACEGARGTLPLLAFAVSRLWELRDPQRRLLTRTAHDQMGGVAGALGQHAEAALTAVGTAREGIVREVFRNLVTSRGTRAVVEREQLLSVFPEREAAEEVLRRLVEARLLTCYHAEGEAGHPGRERIEIVHESLLTAWPRLARWRAQDEDGARLRDQLRQAAQLWAERNRSRDLLWTGTAAHEFGLWRSRYPGALTALEEDFARAMREKARRRRRLVRATTAFAILGLVAVTIAIGVSRHGAVQAARRAEASELLAFAQARLASDPTEALALATASLELADTGAARVFAVKALSEGPPAREFVGGMLRTPSFSPSGRWLAVGGNSSDIRVLSAEGGRALVLRLDEPGANPYPAIGAWASDELLVTGRVGGDRVEVWSLPQGRRVRTIGFGRHSQWHVWSSSQLLCAETEDGGSGGVLLRSWRLPGGEGVRLGRVAPRQDAPLGMIAPDGRSWLAPGDHEITMLPLPVGSGRSRRLAPLEAKLVWPLYAVSSPDRLVATDEKGTVHVWSFPLGWPESAVKITRLERRPEGWPDPSGRWLAGYREAASRQHELRLWDLRTEPFVQHRTLRREGAWANAPAAFHPAGEWIVASNAESTRLRFWPLHRSAPSVVDRYSGPVAFSPDGGSLAMVADENRLRLWSLSGPPRSSAGPLPVLPSSPWVALAFAPQAKSLFGVTGDLFAPGERSVWLLPLDGEPPRRLPGTTTPDTLFGVVVSPGGRWVATAAAWGGPRKKLLIYDLLTGGVQELMQPPGAAAPVTGPAPSPAATGFEGGIVGALFAGERTLLTAGDGGIRRWNLSDGSHTLVCAAPAGQATSAAFSADARTALVTHRPRSAMRSCAQPMLCDLTSGSARRLPEFGDCVHAVALHRSGTVAATLDGEGLVRVGRLGRGTPHLLFGHARPIRRGLARLEISPDLRWLASVGLDETLRLWPMPDLEQAPLHAIGHQELLARLHALTNLRAKRDPSLAGGFAVTADPFTGWSDVPSW